MRRDDHPQAHCPKSPKQVMEIMLDQRSRAVAQKIRSPLSGRLAGVMDSLHCPEAPLGKEVVLVVGPPRSGTSWTASTVGQLLDADGFTNFVHAAMGVGNLASLAQSRLGVRASWAATDVGHVQGLSGASEGSHLWSHYFGFAVRQRDEVIPAADRLQRGRQMIARGPSRFFRQLSQPSLHVLGKPRRPESRRTSSCYRG